MNKRQLRIIPIKKQDLIRQKNTYVLYPYRKLINKEYILIIDCYYSENETPSYRVFMSQSDYTTLDLLNNKWNSARIEYILNYNWYIDTGVVFNSAESEEIIEKFCKMKRDKTFIVIMHHQEKIRTARLVERDRKITDPIDARMDAVPKLPKNFEKFIKEDALYNSRYIFYEYSRKKEVRAYCSWCNSWITVSGARHNEKGMCPNCTSDITYKSMNKQKSILDTVRACIIQKNNEELIFRYFHVSREFNKKEKEREPYKSKEYYYEYNRKFYSLEGHFKESYTWEDFKQRGNRWCKSGYLYKVEAVLYSLNIEEIFKKTTYETSGVELIAKPGFSFVVENLVDMFPTERYIEYLIKSGLVNITKDIIYAGRQHYGYKNITNKKDGIINPEAKTIHDLLKIDKQDIELLKAADANLKGLEYLQYCRKNKIKPIKEHNIFVQQLNRLSDITQFREYTSLAKSINYILKVKKCGDYQERIIIWADYLNMCKTLEYDTSKSIILFPKKLKDRHDALVDEINAIKDAEKKEEERKQSEKIKKQYTKLNKKYSYKDNKYSVLIPKDAEEIKKEGRTLHHCVGSYVESVSKGSTIILFLRENKDIKEPFYTIEIKKDEIRQCRGKNNRDMTKSIKNFINKFKKEKLNNVERMAG